MAKEGRLREEQPLRPGFPIKDAQEIDRLNGELSDETFFRTSFLKGSMMSKGKRTGTSLLGPFPC